MVGGRGAAVLLIGVALTGCSTSATERSDASSQAQSLWSARSAYVGDSSRMTALVREVGLGPAGSYGIELQTAHAPYAMTVAFTKLKAARRHRPQLERDPPARVGRQPRPGVGHLGSAGLLPDVGRCLRKLGYDVKELGRDQRKLTAYLEKSRD